MAARCRAAGPRSTARRIAGPGDQSPIIGAIDRLGAEEDTQAIIAALDAGVDDCIAKPFGLDELAAHIRKVLRRDIWRRGETPCFSSPALQIDLCHRHIYRCGRTHSLSRRQFQLLKLLLDADGRVLTHRDLMHAIWGRTIVATLPCCGR